MMDSILKGKPDARKASPTKPRRGALLRRYGLMLLVAFATVRAGAADPATWYVDDDNYGQSGLDGSKEHPYGTIQDAVDRASTGDTIKVAPGLYNRGYTESTKDGHTFRNRVVIDKKSLTIEATSTNRADTVIQGASAATATGLGKDAVRCVYITENKGGTDTVIRGFTFQGGARSRRPTPHPIVRQTPAAAWWESGAPATRRTSRP